MCICHILLVYSYASGRLSCFYILATVSNAVVNMGVQNRILGKKSSSPLHEKTYRV